MSDWPDRVGDAYDAALDGAAVLDTSVVPLAVDVPAEHWAESALVARNVLGCSFFDWLSAVDEGDDGLRLVTHLASYRPGCVDHLLVRTLVPPDEPVLGTLRSVYAGADWHERETHEMFGVDFTEDGAVLELATLLLPEEFEGHPLRKEFVLASRAVRPWPGAKEPGESDATPARRSRRRPSPPGVPTVEEWGPRNG